ncbi:type II toxin-antitoxin system VapC family toxin [Candidatus Saganbacteria bacterium]|nr:type II toxin-antitoxin system VapC family toxin [Candidatus Saganbacteria bacterium]
MKYFFIDTNIIIYAQGAQHKYKSPCQTIMRLIALNEIFGATNTEVLQEVLYRYSAIGKKQLGIQMVENTLNIMHEVISIERADIILAMELLKKHCEINVRDAIHAASAIRGNFKYILSVDKHFDRIKNLQRVDPFNL